MSQKHDVLGQRRAHLRGASSERIFGDAGVHFGVILGRIPGPNRDTQLHRKRCAKTEGFWRLSYGPGGGGEGQDLGPPL